MRKIFDTLVMYLFKWCFNWLFRQYDILFDGIEIWIQDKLPGTQDVPSLDEEFGDGIELWILDKLPGTQDVPSLDEEFGKE